MNIYKVESCTEMSEPKGVKLEVRNEQKQHGVLVIEQQQVNTASADDTGLLTVITKKATVGLQFGSVKRAAEVGKFLQGLQTDLVEQAYAQVKPVKQFEIVDGMIYCLTETGELWSQRVSEPNDKWKQHKVGIDVYA